MLTARHYQEAGIDFLLKRKKAMLADDPGLGKTFQALEATNRANAYPAIVMCPAHLVRQWAEVAQAQYPTLTVSYSTKADFYVRDWALSKPSHIYVCNTEMLRNIDNFFWPPCKTIIFDESHHLKNRNSKQTQGAMKLVFKNNPEYVFCLTATPIKREADDLFSQFRLLRPEIFTSYNTFVKTFCVEELTAWDSQVIGIKNKEALLKLLDLVMLKREYKDAGLELPELIESIIPVQFNDTQRKAYERLERDLILQYGEGEAIPYMWYIQALQTLRRMTACNEKIEACVMLAEDAERPVVFTHYKDTARKIAESLNVPFISGDNPANTRPTLAKNQQRLVATIDSLTEGVDLSEFDTVIFAEEDYTPGVNFQALSRVRRFGARVDIPILKYCIHVKDTIDERIHEISERRGVTAQNLIQDVLELKHND